MEESWSLRRRENLQVQADSKPNSSVRLNTTFALNEFLELITQFSRKTGMHIDRIEHFHLYISEANMDNAKKTDSSTVIGNTISGSTIGSVGMAKDVNVFVALVDSFALMSDELKAQLKDARGELELTRLSQEDKEDVSANLHRLAQELDKPRDQIEPARVKRFLERVKEVASPVAALLSIAASIAKLAH